MSEQGALLDETADRMFGRAVAEHGRQGEGLTAALAAAWDDAGLSLTLTPEEAGGLAAPLADAAVLAWRAGVHGVPLAVTELLLLGALADVLGDASPATLAEGAGHRFAGGALDGGSLRAPALPGAGAEVPGLWAVLTGGETPGVALVRPARAMAEESLSHDLWLCALPSDVVVEEFLPLDPSRVAALRVAGALLTAANMVGAMRAALDLTVDHVTTRKQFGRPLAKFQALQHQLADAAAERVATEAVLGEALRRADAGASDALQWRAAKLQAARAARVVGTAVHQCHGAIGYTREHDLHLFTGRMWDGCDLWGRQRVLEAYLGRSAARAGSDLWPLVVGAGGVRA